MEWARPTGKRRAASVALLPAPSSATELPLGQTRLDWIIDPLRAFNLYRAKRSQWFETISAAPTTYPPPVLKARAEELGAKIARLKEWLGRPPPATTGEAWLGEAERLARLEGQAAAIGDVLEIRAARVRGQAAAERSRWLFQGKRAREAASEAASACTPNPEDPFSGE